VPQGGGKAPAAPMADWSKETAGEVASHIGKNFLPSLQGTVGSFADAVTHPVETLSTLGKVGAGVGSQVGNKLGFKPDARAQENMRLAKAIESHYGNIYMPALHGDFRPLQTAIETDPTGTLLDWSTLVGLPGGALKAGATGAKLASGAAKAANATKLAAGLTKAADVAGAAGKVASTVGKAVDPLTYATMPLKLAGKAAGATTRALSSAATGVDSGAFKAAVEAGKAPLGAEGRAFLGSMISPNPTKVARNITNAVGTVEKQSVANTRAAKAALQGVTPSYDPIYDAIDAARTNLGGDATKEAGLFPHAHSALDDLEQSVRTYEQAGPANLDNVDTLRRAVYDTAKGHPNAEARSALMNVYHEGVVKSLQDAYPGYADVSEAAKEGMQNVRDLSKDLGASKNATTAQTIKKAMKAATGPNGSNLMSQIDKVDRTISPSLHGMSLHKMGSHNDINYALAALNPVAAAKAYTLSSPMLNGLVHYGIGMGQGAGEAAVNAGKAGSTLSRVNEPETPVAETAPQAAPGDPSAPPTPDEDAAVKMVYGEARGESPEGQAGTVHTFLNRTKLSGHSLQDEIYRPNASEAITNGVGKDLDVDDPMYQRILNEIVRPSLRGEIKDPTNGATHFLAPRGMGDAKHHWPGWAREPTATIGHHNFYGGNFFEGGRVGRASGGKVHDVRRHEYLVNRLLSAAKDAKTVTDKTTEPLLNVPDEHIVKALDVAQRAI
jgi:hypothetical protein